MNNIEQPVVTFTESAIVAIQEALDSYKQEENVVPETPVKLRLSVMGGGCAGFQYEMSFDLDTREDDLILQAGSVEVLIDSISTSHLQGTTIDFKTGLNGTGFKFINPNAKRTCGCGSSFS